MVGGVNWGVRGTSAHSGRGWRRSIALTASLIVVAAGCMPAAGPLPDTTAPSVPTAVAARANTTTQVTVTWSASTDDIAVTGYEVARDGRAVATVSALRYTDVSLTMGSTHSYTVRARDAAGNVSGPSAKVTVTMPTVDATAPTVAITGPAAGATISGTVLVTAGATDDTGVAGVQFLLDGRALNGADTSAPFSTSWDTTGVANGSHQLAARARDAAGNVTTSVARTVTVTNAPSTSTGLTAGYAFDEGTGTSAADASGHGIIGVLLNGAGWDTGKHGGSLKLTGGADDVSLGNPSALRITGSMTISAWINSAAFPVDDAAIVSKRGATSGFQLDTTVDTGRRTIGFKLSTGSGADMMRYGTTTLQPNSWYHVAGVYDAAAQTMHVYLDGQLDDGQLQGTVAAAQQDSPLDVLVGQRASGGFGFNGRIDDLRIYARALLAADVQADMNSALHAALTPVAAASANPTSGPAPLTVSFSSAGSSAPQGRSLSFTWTFGDGASSTSANPSHTYTAPGPYTARLTVSDGTDSASAPALAITVDTPTPVDAAAPSTPTGLTASASSPSTANVAWNASTDNVGVTGYRLYRNGTQIASPSGTTYTDTGLAAGTTYSYAVAAVDAAGNQSARSAAASVTTPPPAAAAFVKSVSPNGRYLLDQNGRPIMVVGDSPHTLFQYRTTAEADLYLANRQRHGVNAVWAEVLCNGYIGCPDDGHMYDGNLPFGTAAQNFDTPNPAYFAHIDEIVQKAADHGITVFMDPIDLAGWIDVLKANGPQKAFRYGAYLGNRYKNFPNIVWQHGNDYTSVGQPDADAAAMAVLDGIASADPNHLQTLELYPTRSSTLDAPQWASRVDINESYTYFATYDENLHAYDQTPTMPVLMVEAGYEFENVGGRQVANSPNTLRRQEYWSATTGTSGQLYGSFYTYRPTDWATEAAHLDSPGAVQLGYMAGLFRSLPWHELVPDQDHTFLTAGFGTHDPGNDANEIVSSDYATAARSADGHTGVVYTPAAHTLTIDMSKLSGPVTARWFDPSTGTFRAISGSPFPNSGSRQFTTPGNNGAGDADWVLLLQS